MKRWKWREETSQTLRVIDYRWPWRFDLAVWDEEVKLKNREPWPLYVFLQNWLRDRVAAVTSDSVGVDFDGGLVELQFERNFIPSIKFLDFDVETLEGSNSILRYFFGFRFRFLWEISSVEVKRFWFFFESLSLSSVTMFITGTVLGTTLTSSLAGCFSLFLRKTLVRDLDRARIALISDRDFDRDRSRFFNVRTTFEQGSVSLAQSRGSATGAESDWWEPLLQRTWRGGFKGDTRGFLLMFWSWESNVFWSGNVAGARLCWRWSKWLRNRGDGSFTLPKMVGVEWEDSLDFREESGR